MRTKVKRIGAAVATAIVVGGGVLGLAPAANAQAANPCPEIDEFYLFGANQWGAGWGANGELQSWNVAGTRPVTIFCHYYGENWQFVAGQGSEQVGYTDWTRRIVLG